jgi:nondiscriminating aspartyl-tRNA synthetase
MVAGWVWRLRRIGGIAFLVLRDRSGTAQVVFESRNPEAGAVSALNAEDVVEVRGTVRADRRAPGGVEVLGETLKLVSAAAPLPFEVNLPEIKAGLDILLDNRVVSLRHPHSQAVFRLKAAIAGGFRRFSEAAGMIEVHTPKIVATGTEGGANLFAVDYLGRPAYLAQSPQFYKQLLVIGGFERVFEVGPVYRAEPHNTSRHLNEFTSMDWEIGFIRSAAEVMDLEEEMLREMTAAICGGFEPELAALGVDAAGRLPAGSIPRIPLTEALALLERRYGKVCPPGDLDPEGERLLCEAGGGAVFVTDWPLASRPAYAAPWEDRPELTDSFDLLLGGVEVTTGGRRISDHRQLVASFRSRGLDPDRFGFYLDAFRYGTPPHGGLATGLERLTMALLGIGNMREVTFFPRDLERVTP